MARHLVGHAEHGLAHFLGEPGIEQALQDRQCRGRRFLGGLENHRAAGGDGRTELAAGIADGEVPGCKGRDRPDRLADYGRPHARGAHELASVKTVTLAGIELEQRDVHHDFDARLGERLALLERRDARDLFLSLPEQPRGARQHRRALLGGGIAPEAEAPLRGSERAVEIGRVRERQCAERGPGRGVHDRVHAPVADGNLFPVDDHVQLGVTHGPYALCASTLSSRSTSRP